MVTNIQPQITLPLGSSNVLQPSTATSIESPQATAELERVLCCLGDGCRAAPLPPPAAPAEERSPDGPSPSQPSTEYYGDSWDKLSPAPSSGEAPKRPAPESPPEAARGNLAAEGSEGKSKTNSNGNSNSKRNNVTH